MAIGHYICTDGSGTYVIIIDSAKCNGAGCCVLVCPYKVFVMEEEDPLEGKQVAVIPKEKKANLKYHCADCKSLGNAKPPCVEACKAGAIEHTFF